MPVDLYLDILRAFAKRYGNDLSVELVCDLGNALIPICRKCDDGKYNVPPKQPTPHSGGRGGGVTSGCCGHGGSPAADLGTGIGH